MLEVCFSDSVKATLRFAQTCGNANGATSIGIIGDRLNWWQKRKAFAKARRTYQVLEKEAISLGGKKEDLIGISFDLSIGDISSPLTLEDCPRKQFIKHWLTADTHGDDDKNEFFVNEFWRECMADLDTLKKRANMEESVRIWADPTPTAACGLLFVADLLVDIDCEITIVPLPKNKKHIYSPNKEYSSWSEVEPQLFGRFLDDSRILTKEDMQALSHQWRKLQVENAPLRVVEEDIVVSANEDYYDEYIRKEFSENTCNVGTLIGNVISNIHVSDWLIAQRIKVLIAQNELKIVDSSEKDFYRTIISK